MGSSMRIATNNLPGKFDIARWLLLYAILAISGCGVKISYEGEVLQEVINGDGSVTATLTRFNGGATTSFTDRVYLKEMQTGVVTEMLLADKTLGSKLEWDGSNKVVIHMPCAHIHKFTNFLELLNSERQYVKTIEVALVTDGLCLSKFGYTQ